MTHENIDSSTKCPFCINIYLLCVYLFVDPIFCPHLLPPKAALTLKLMLQHQPWNEKFILQLEETEDNADIHQTVSDQLDILDP